MTAFDFVMLAIPVAFLILSAFLCVKAFEKGKSPKKTVYTQIASFVAVFAVCLLFPTVAGAAEVATTGAVSGGDFGMGLIGAGIATGLSCIGGGIAVGGAAPAAIGATSEDSKNFGKSIIFVALGEGCALYGMLISIMILSKLG